MTHSTGELSSCSNLLDVVIVSARDPLSPEFQHNLPKLRDNGRNHIVFNLYSGTCFNFAALALVSRCVAYRPTNDHVASAAGTWPDYHELDFAGLDIGDAMLVKASSSCTNYRPGFDISLPLFSRTHPERGTTVSTTDSFAAVSDADDVDVSISTIEHESSPFGNKHLLVFKGKRYIYGIGSETRNSLHHLHNGNDVLMYTTCKHGKKWKELRDDRCEQDNRVYERVDYLTLMSNSTFCLAPRGRRYGSFRFLEALQLGCIPVTLSNDWVKPFADVIDWSDVVVDGDERLLMQLPDMLRSFDRAKLELMRAKTKTIYETYFSSVERIVLTTISVLSERIQSHQSLTSFLWNMANPSIANGFSGAIWFDDQFSQDLADYPGYRYRVTADANSVASRANDYYTALITVNRPIATASVLRLIRSVLRSKNVAKVVRRA